LRHRRSRRQPFFGQISPLRRPFGALASGEMRRLWRPATGKGTLLDDPPVRHFLAAGRLLHSRRGYRLRERPPLSVPRQRSEPTPPRSANFTAAIQGTLAIRPSRRSAVITTRGVQTRRCCPTNGDRRRQARTGPWPGGTAAAIAAMRVNAVAPTATAPINEKTICQASDGMVCFTMPCVA